MGHTEAITAVIGVAMSPIIWNIIARAEYRTHFLTKLCLNNKYIGCYVLALWIFTSSLYRDHLIHAAIQSEEPLPLLVSLQPGLTVLAAVLFAVGMTFVLSAYYRLGITGTYLGDYFGILMKERVTAFPFNTLEHPMYDGATMCFAASALYYSSFVGLWLSVWVFIVYRVSTTYFEGPFTTMIYEQAAKKKKAGL
eukprot:PhF_6_TR7176/c0_g1_i1/m.10731/K00551/PEMT; phosphatidylethanolamine N-methyltransferase